MKVNDEQWIRFQKQIEEYAAAKNYFGIGTTYYEMASSVDGEAHAQQLRDEGYKFKLANSTRYLNESLADMVDLMVNKGACNACLANDGKINSNKAELTNTTLPVKDCSNPIGCRCTYLPYIAD